MLAPMLWDPLFMEILKLHTLPCMWASPENPMKAFLYQTTTDSLKNLPRKVAMVRAKGTLDFAKDVS